MISRIQFPKYAAAALKAANPLLLDGEIVYESDTGRHKIGDGVTEWWRLPYASDAEEIPAVTWKVQRGMLCIKPATDLKNPILKRCMIGILHYKNARRRVQKDLASGTVKSRPQNAGFKLVQDSFAQEELSWTTVRINPVPFDAKKANTAGWLPVISVADLFQRWVVRIPDPDFAGGGKFELHRGSNIGDRTGDLDSHGKTKMQVSFFGGVVLFTGDAKYRTEGPRCFFKVAANNYGLTPSILHI